MKKTAIFGGSFDPVHKGHQAVIAALRQRFDRVIVVPASVSPFKMQGSAASGSQRLAMLGLAVFGRVKTGGEIKSAKTAGFAEISDFEIAEGGVSYSANTARFFSEAGTKLYFAVGAEEAGFLHKWKDAEYLQKNVCFLVIKRKGFEVSVSEGFEFEVLDGEFDDTSSSLFKAAYALGKGGQLVDKKVLGFIKKHKNSGLYCDYMDFAKGLKRFGLDKSRINHTYFAVKAGIALAKIHGEDVGKTVTALMLHDVAKNITPAMMKKHNVDESGLENVPRPVHHSIIGAQIAQNYFGISDEDVLNSIRFHTTSRPLMSRLEKIVALADYVEESRKNSQISGVYSLARQNLDAAMLQMLQNNMEYLSKDNKEIDENSVQALAFYRNLVYNNDQNKG